MQLWTLHIKRSMKSWQNINKKDYDLETIAWVFWWCTVFPVGITDMCCVRKEDHMTYWALQFQTLWSGVKCTLDLCNPFLHIQIISLCCLVIAMLMLFQGISYIFFWIQEHLDYLYFKASLSSLPICLVDFRVNVLIKRTVISILWCRWNLYLAKDFRYSKEWGEWETYTLDLIRKFLETNRCFPVFLCGLKSKLFTKKKKSYIQKIPSVSNYFFLLNFNSSAWPYSLKLKYKLK